MESQQVSHTRYCEWPPKVIHTKDLGYLEDTNGRYYPRDIGCSSVVNGIPVFQFGDTFVHNGNKKFVGVTCANASVVKDISKPQLSTYCGVEHNGSVPTNPPHIPSDRDDDQYRTSTWCFGGIVWRDCHQGGVAEGFTYFQNSQINKHKWEEKIHHTGIANVSLNTATYQIFMTRTPDDDVLFNASEPRFGTFSAIRHEHYVYAYGHGSGSNSRNVVLARVPLVHLKRLDCYEYFDGRSFQHDMSKCHPVLTDMQHGTIWHSKLFGLGKEWVFVGCNSFADSIVHIGTAPHPGGPWDVKQLIPAPQKNPQQDSKFTYCHFAHPWAFDEGKGELMVSWSEGGMRGKVVAAKVSLKQFGGVAGSQVGLTKQEDSFVDKVKGRLQGFLK